MTVSQRVPGRLRPASRPSDELSRSPPQKKPPISPRLSSSWRDRVGAGSNISSQLPEAALPFVRMISPWPAMRGCVPPGCHTAGRPGISAPAGSSTSRRPPRFTQPSNASKPAPSRPRRSAAVTTTMSSGSNAAQPAANPAGSTGKSSASPASNSSGALSGMPRSARTGKTPTRSAFCRTSSRAVAEATTSPPATSWTVALSRPHGLPSQMTVNSRVVPPGISTGLAIARPESRLLMRNSPTKRASAVTSMCNGNGLPAWPNLP